MFYYPVHTSTCLCLSMLFIFILKQKRSCSILSLTK